MTPAAAVQAANAIETEASGLENIHDPRERWHAYFERCLIQGVGAFNENECLIIEAERFHYRVWRCVYHELMRTAGVPQLATVVCDLDVPYHNRLFPSFAFHRGDSERNTLAYGNRWCDYVWDQRTSSDRGRAGGRA